MQTDLTVIARGASTLWRWKWAILLVALIAASATWVSGFRTPRQYEGEATLLYRFGREYFPVSPGEQRRNWGENVIVSLDAAIFTEMRLLSSHDLFRTTMTRLGWSEFSQEPAANPLAEGSSPFFAFAGAVPPERSGAPASSPEAETADAIRNFAKAFSIERIQGSSVVTVAARHSLAEVADRMVAEHVAAYLNWRSELFDRDADSFFTAQIEAARRELSGLLENHSQTKKRFDVVDLDVEFQVARQRLSEIERALVTDPRNQRLQDNATEARQTLSKLNELNSIMIPLQARISASEANVALLEQERANWNLMRSYSSAVAPAVELIDNRTAFGNPVGLSLKVKVVAAAIFGAVLAAASILIAGFLARMMTHPTTRHPEPAGSRGRD